MITKHGKHVQFAIVLCTTGATLLLGTISSSAQSTRYLFTGSKTNVTLNPGLYNITVYGAQGGAYLWYPPVQLYGGLGAEMEGEFDFTNVTTLTLLVGGTGQAAGDYNGAGGGGGSFVVNGTTPLIIAGGGGGAADAQAMFSPVGSPGLTSGTGGNGSDGDGDVGGGGGSLGGGGNYSTNSGGYGGGGYSGDGGVSFYGGKSYLNGGAGGEGYYENGNNGQGGYGGGGGGNQGGGGGGGYSGGGGGGSLSGGGGGGSYIDSSAVVDITEISGVASPDGSPNGEIIITPVPPSLFISESGISVSVYWAAMPGWSLQQNTDLTNPSGWTACGGVSTVNGTNYFNTNAPSGNLFFRLQGQ